MQFNTLCEARVHVHTSIEGGAGYRSSQNSYIVVIGYELDGQEFDYLVPQGNFLQNLLVPQENFLKNRSVPQTALEILINHYLE